MASIQTRHESSSLLQKIQDIGVSHLMDHDMMTRQGRARLDQPDKPLLEQQQWTLHMVFEIDRLVLLCDNPAQVKALIRHHMQARHNDTLLGSTLRLTRGVHIHDMYAQRDVRGGKSANTGSDLKRKRSDSPLQGQLGDNGAEMASKEKKSNPESRNVGYEGHGTSPRNVAPSSHSSATVATGLAIPTASTTTGNDAAVLKLKGLLHDDLVRLRAINKEIGVPAAHEKETEAAKFAVQLIATFKQGDGVGRTLPDMNVQDMDVAAGLALYDHDKEERRARLEREQVLIAERAAAVANILQENHGIAIFPSKRSLFEKVLP